MRVANPGQAIQHYVASFNMTSILNDKLLSSLQLYHFPAYTYIYIERDEQHVFYFLVEGEMQCNHYHANGKLSVIGLYKPFAAMGDFEILSEERVKCNVIATQDTTALGIAKTEVRRYGEDDPRFLRFLYDQVRAKAYMKSDLQKSQILPLINRLATYLVAQPTHDGEGALILPGKEELAPLLGTTPRHLNRVLKELVSSGCISAGYPLVRILKRSDLRGFVV
jgi:CRP-like cAMP-binding protein